MTKETNIKLFEEKKVRTTWDEENEEWYFSVVDAVAILTESENPRRYWSDLKIKLEKEGSQLYEKIVQLKLLASDGKLRMTEVAVRGGKIARNARQELELQIGKSAISSLNAKSEKILGEGEEK